MPAKTASLPPDLVHVGIHPALRQLLRRDEAAGSNEEGDGVSSKCLGWLGHPAVDPRTAASSGRCLAHGQAARQ